MTPECCPMNSYKKIKTPPSKHSCTINKLLDQCTVRWDSETENQLAELVIIQPAPSEPSWCLQLWSHQCWQNKQKGGVTSRSRKKHSERTALPFPYEVWLPSSAHMLLYNEVSVRNICSCPGSPGAPTLINFQFYCFRKSRIRWSDLYMLKATWGKVSHAQSLLILYENYLKIITHHV